MNQHLLNILPTFFKTRKAFTSIKTLRFQSGGKLPREEALKNWLLKESILILNYMTCT